MSTVALMGALELGLIYSLLALGIYISYRVLNVADLTVEGTFPCGAAVSAVFADVGRPFVGLLMAVLVCALAGCVTALLQTKLRIQPILAGILTMTALYSINLRIMSERANISLLRRGTLFTMAKERLGSQYGPLIVAALVVVVVAVLLMLFFHTGTGYAVRATGDNEEMVRSSSINSDYTKFVGLAMANGVVGLSGGLIAQYQLFADISLGSGMVVVALASLIIGEALLGRRGVVRSIIGVVLGAVLYRIILTVVLASNVRASDLKLISAVIVTVAISYPALKSKIGEYRLRKAGGGHA